MISSQTVDVIEAMRGTRMFVPTMLAVLCGLRRGEIAALRWEHLDLVAWHMAIAESAEQIGTSIRYKPPKSGRGRSVALSGTMVEELRAHRAELAEQLLKLGKRLTDNDFVCTQPDGEPMQPVFITREWILANRED